MIDKPAYLREHWVRAVNASAVLGWLTVVGPAMPEMNWGLLLWVGIIGLPIAFLTSWVIVAPILSQVMRRPISWARAVGWGIVISLTIAVAGFAAGRYINGRVSGDSWSIIAGFDYYSQIQGHLTPYGWWSLARHTAQFVLSGVAVGLILRAILGPGRVDPPKRTDVPKFPLP